MLSFSFVQFKEVMLVCTQRVKGRVLLENQTGLALNLVINSAINTQI